MLRFAKRWLYFSHNTCHPSTSYTICTYTVPLQILQNFITVSSVDVGSLNFRLVEFQCATCQGTSHVSVVSIACRGRGLSGHVLLPCALPCLRHMSRPPRSEKAEWATDLGFSQADRFDLRSHVSILSCCVSPLKTFY